MRIDQNKPKNLNPWINHWHSNHKASHFARCCLWIIIWNACIWRELQTGFFYQQEKYSHQFWERIGIFVLANAPENGNKKQRTEKWNADDDKKIIHGKILPHHSNDCRSFTFSLLFRFEVSMACTNFIECSLTVDKI